MQFVKNIAYTISDQKSVIIEEQKGVNYWKANDLS